jgi:hypothetical protein
MRVPRKIKKAAKHVERHMRHTTSGLWLIPYSEFVVKGRCTKWKLKCLNEVKRELQRRLLENWQHFNGTILMH